MKITFPGQHAPLALVKVEAPKPAPVAPKPAYTVNGQAATRERYEAAFARAEAGDFSANPLFKPKFNCTTCEDAPGDVLLYEGQPGSNWPSDTHGPCPDCGGAKEGDPYKPAEWSPKVGELCHFSDHGVVWSCASLFVQMYKDQFVSVSGQCWKFCRPAAPGAKKGDPYKPEPKRGEWIEWKGGEFAVAPMTRVEVRYCGLEAKDYARYCNWDSIFAPIIAYRICEDQS